jgi:hypothetical protein
VILLAKTLDAAILFTLDPTVQLNATPFTDGVGRRGLPAIRVSGFPHRR